MRALGLAALKLTGSHAYATEDREGGNIMARDIVMMHGANEGGWCFDKFTECSRASVGPAMRPT